MRLSPCIKPDRASGAWTRPTREGRCFYLTRASPSILGYDHDLDESIIRLLNDMQHFGQREVEEF
jgi:hypothetical protein